MRYFWFRGVRGGEAWCIATATIAFTDRFDQRFPVAGSLIAVWAVAAGDVSRTP